MILDYAYNRNKKTLSVSYVESNGSKKILSFNVSRFKSYYSTPSGKFKNWDGSNCDIKYVDNPCNFDIRTFFEEIGDDYKKLLNGKYSPKLYTFDIETEISDEFPDPAEAKYPITTISVASPDCNVIVLGVKELKDTQNLQNRFDEYLENSSFFKSLKIKQPYIKYIKFNDERSMLQYFLKEIVAKVPVLAGWNSIMFDWQYIQNRLRATYPDMSLSISSLNGQMTYKNYQDMRGDKVRMCLPNHTLILDMMDVIGSFDMVVLPIKESLSLDYIASESVGMNKIKYDGDLQKLFEEDYSTYVFYNAIDSVLVQLIDKRFKTLQNIYAQSLYCKEKIGSCFSKIALTEALFFNYFYENNIKIVPTYDEDKHRGVLVGAYVAVPTPGKHKWVTCNDFASLYPSIIRSNNISIENFVGSFYDEVALAPYKADNKNYIVVGANVYKNAGTFAKPEMGEHIGIFLREDLLTPYRNDPNYFVSVNGHVYKNDKDYAFKCIQTNLANDRNKSKYLSKQLDALVMSDIEHIKIGKEVSSTNYPDNIISKLKDLGWDITNGHDIQELAITDINKLEKSLKDEITYLTSYEQGCKLLMNSAYGGSSHVAFAWFSNWLPNDITGEAKNLIKIMEKHIPEYIQNNWYNMTDLHNKLGIKLKQPKL